MEALKTPPTHYYPAPDRYPIEHQAVQRVEQLLSAQNWPFRRVHVHVVFDVTSSMPSRHRLDLVGRNGLGHQVGRAEIFLNLAYLHQNPGFFLNDTIPHECAHLLVAAEASEKGAIYGEHGEEWQGYLARLNAKAKPKANAWREMYDSRGVLLANGGIPAQCSCDDDNFHVLSDAKPSKTPTCEHCKSILKPSPGIAQPDALRREAAYLVKMKGVQDLYGWLDS